MTPAAEGAPSAPAGAPRRRQFDNDLLREFHQRSAASAASATSVSRSNAPPPPLPPPLGAAATETVADAFADPPPPVQLREKVVVALIAEVVTGPPVGLSLPFHAELLGLADAIQLVAFVAVQDRLTVPPELTLALLAVRVTAGAGSTLIA